LTTFAKAKVEVAVLIVERFVLAKLRNRRFFSLDELNLEVHACVATINAKVMKKFAKSRRELLETIDSPALKELPSEPYRYADWKRCGVAPDYHVEIDDHYYSVPFRLLRETVEANGTSVGHSPSEGERYGISEPARLARKTYV
jgi:hypothetical protein